MSSTTHSSTASEVASTTAKSGSRVHFPGRDGRGPEVFIEKLVHRFQCRFRGVQFRFVPRPQLHVKPGPPEHHGRRGTHLSCAQHTDALDGLWRTAHGGHGMMVTARSRLGRSSHCLEIEILYNGLMRHPATTQRRRVSLLIETSSAYGRGLLRGIARWMREQDAWTASLGEYRSGQIVPEELRRGECDGVIARIESPKLASYLATLKLPMVDVSRFRLLPARALCGRG